MVSVKQIIISFILPITVAIIIPYTLLLVIGRQPLVPLLNENLLFLILGFIILCLSLILFIKCNIIFVKIGKGTLMPHKDLETQSLIIVGPYKYVRNPMIISVILILVSESFIFNAISVLIWALGFFLGNIFYIPLFEEKGLEKRFGGEYLAYKNSVRGWIPHLKPYNPKITEKRRDE